MNRRVLLAIGGVLIVAGVAFFALMQPIPAPTQTQVEQPLDASTFQASGK